MIAFVMKLIQLVPLQLASVLGVVQAIVKLLKEVITSIVNFIFPFTSDNGQFESWVMKIRLIVDKVDGILERVKSFILLKLKLTV